VIFEPCISIGWGKIGPKGAQLLILFAGDDIELAQKAADEALASGLVSYTRVIRGPFPGASQLMAASGPGHCYQPPGPTLPAGSK
jgi:hypothetical protein